MLSTAFPPSGHDGDGVGGDDLAEILRSLKAHPMPMPQMGSKRIEWPRFAPAASRPRCPPGQLKLGPHYRAPARPSQEIRFWFRTRLVCATATAADDVHHNVLRLHIHGSLIQRVLASLINLLPSPARARLVSFLPEWTLPSRLVLKKQKDGWDDEFETEKATYARLRPLQGVVIPRYFGELVFEEKKATLLSDIGGAALATPEGLLLQLPELRRLVHQALDAFIPFRIFPSDIKLDNYHLTGGTVMVVDLERMSESECTDEQDAHDINGYRVNHLAEWYETTQYTAWRDGLITIDN